jgi:hypothetical protein
MASKWLALSGVALLLVFAAGSAADARSGGGQGSGGGRSFSGGGGGGGQIRSYSGGQSRSFGGGSSHNFRAPSNFGNRLQLRTQGGSYTKAGTYTKFGPGKPFNKGYAWKHDGKHHGRHHRHRRIFVGVPIIYGGYDYYYYGNCEWLRRRALATGSGYWWDRYNACVYEGY